MNSENINRRRGYSFDKVRNKWKVEFFLDKKRISLGYFDTELEAKEMAEKERLIIQQASMPLDIDKYRDIPEYNGKYKISKDGEIISLLKSKINKISLAKNIAGYLSVVLKKDDGIRKRLLIHRVIYAVFVGPIPQGMDVDHIDRDINNNNIENLRLLTRVKNIYNSKRMDDAKGYTYDEKTGMWRAQIKVAQKNNYLGSFKTKEEARNAYLNALSKFVGMPE
jgi:hypothetical protein